MVEIIVKSGGNEAFYAVVKPNKKDGHTVFVRNSGFSSKLRAIGDIEISEDDGVGGIVKKVMSLLEDISGT